MKAKRSIGDTVRGKSMKKKLLIFLSVLCVFALAGGVLTACTDAHEHTFSSEWTYDGTYHWHAATCEHKDEVRDRTEHTFSDDVCSVCGYKRQRGETELEEYTGYAVSTLLYGDTRIQLLSDSLVRIENAVNGDFEDRDSYVVYNRDDWGDKVAYTIKKTDTSYEVVTEYYTVVIPAGSMAEGMTVEDGKGETIYSYLGVTGTNVWLPAPSDELSSWYFTDSPRVIPSDYGYSVNEASDAPVQGWEFQENVTDIFVFLPHGEYTAFSENFIALTGQTELVSLDMLGYWDSRYYAYTDKTALQQIDDYKEHGFAIDILVIDTDWRDASQGFGYDINTDLFPDMEDFLKKAHERGVNICFNDHPQPVAGTGNLLDSEEVAYRNENLIMLLSLGVDYWWYDRNWSVALNPISDDVSRYATGMYAYQWITQEYYDSLVEQGAVEEFARRALIMGNVDGCENGGYGYASDLSAHRYSIQWTGDTKTGENWLRQEIEGAVMAGAELGLAYVSSDIGGHTGDLVTDNQYIRWFQYGALSSILRVHTSNADTRGRMPWNFGETAVEVAHNYQDMRYRLMALYYALAHENYETGLPIMRRLDFSYPQYVESRNNDEYLLGDYILVAPVWEAKKNAERTVFLPEGTWINVWTGVRYSGPATISVTHDLKTSPIFVREGALVALLDNAANTKNLDWSKPVLDVYPSANYGAQTTLYEDDTDTTAYKYGHFRTTDIFMSCAGNVLTLNIGAAQGTFDNAGTQRTWTVRLHENPGWGEIVSVKVNGTAVQLSSLKKTTYDAGGRPFAYEGSALDGDVITFDVPTNVSEAYTIEIQYTSVQDSANASDSYDATAVDYRITATRTEETSVNLTELGTTDWAAYGWASASANDYKKGGSRLFSVVSPFMWCEGVSNYVPSLVTSGGVKRNYTDGGRVTAVSPSGGISVPTAFKFEVKTMGAHEKIVLYLGGTQTIAKLTVRDRAGNVKTLQFGGREEENFVYKVEIEVAAGEASTLYFDYQARCGNFRKNTAGVNGSLDMISSRVQLYCGYICPVEDR